MTIITINTSEKPTAVDLAIINAYLDSVVPVADAEPVAEIEPPKKRTRKPKTAVEEVLEEKTAEPTPEDVADAESAAAGDPEPAGPTKDDAVKKVTELLGNGGREKVKAALEAAGAKRVSELSDDQVAPFLAALDA